MIESVEQNVMRTDDEDIETSSDGNIDIKTSSRSGIFLILLRHRMKEPVFKSSLPFLTVQKLIYVILLICIAVVATVLGVVLTNNDKNNAAVSSNKQTSTTVVSSSLWIQESEDINGGSSNELIGYAVAMSNDGNRFCAGGNGNVRIYDRNISDGNWSQVIDLSSAFKSELYTQSLSMSSDGFYLIAGDPKAMINGTATVFQQDVISGTWDQVGDVLYGDRESDYFGASVAITGDGSLIAIGTRVKKIVGYLKIFELSSDNEWILKEKLVGGVTETTFGSSLALASDGSRMIVGADHDHNNPDGHKFGSAFIYDLTTSNNRATLLQRIYGETAEEQLGRRVTMSSDGSRIALSAYYYGEAAASNREIYGAGHVKVYNFDADENKFIVIGDSIVDMTDTGFGSSISLSADGSRLAIGADRHDNNEEETNNNRGKTYLYDINENDWSAVGYIAGEAEGDMSGASVALSADGKRVVVGAPWNDGGGTRSGQVSVFEASSEI